jgi:hypothetical protein
VNFAVVSAMFLVFKPDGTKSPSFAWLVGTAGLVLPMFDCANFLKILLNEISFFCHAVRMINLIFTF